MDEMDETENYMFNHGIGIVVSKIEMTQFPFRLFHPFHSIYIYNSEMKWMKWTEFNCCQWLPDYTRGYTVCF